MSELEARKYSLEKQEKNVQPQKNLVKYFISNSKILIL